MSSGFYAECLEEIAQLIRQGRIPEARAKVDTELAMPYVPSDVLPTLQDFDQQLRLLAAENRKPGVGVMSLEEIEEGRAPQKIVMRGDVIERESVRSLDV